MNIEITYDEANKLIKERTGKGVILSYANDNMVNVGYEINVLGISNVIKAIDLKIEKIEDSDIYVHYEGNGDLLVNGLMKIKEHMKLDFIENAGEQCLVVHLDMIPKAKKLLENIKLLGARLEKDSAKIEFTIKNA